MSPDYSSEDPFINIHEVNRPLSDIRPAGPLIGCGHSSDSNVPSTLQFTVDVLDRLYDSDTDPSHFDVVEGIVLEEMPNKINSMQLSMEENRAGDVVVNLDLQNLTVTDIEDIERSIDMMENRDEVVNVYRVKFQR